MTYFAESDHRNRRIKFGIKAKDRSRHTYVIGKTGMGKSTLLENMAVQDIQRGNGLAFIDPHGSTAEKLLEYIPEERLDDVLYFAPFDIDYPISFNVMEDVGEDKRHLVLDGLMSAFKKIWVDAWSSRMEYILGNTILALLEYPGATMLDINPMYTDKDFQRRVVDSVQDPVVKAFWTQEFARYTDRYASEATPAIQNKVGQFTSNPLIRNIIGQSRSSFDVREIMDNKKILIVNLSKGRMGEQNANLLGSMLITKIYLAAMSRADQSQEKMESLPNFYLYVDEFQSFANEYFASILSEARKYKLNLTIAHQYIEQMSDEVRAAVFGNVGTMISFRVGSYDAEVLEKEFAPEFTAEDMVNLGFAQIYLKLMIDGISSPPFSAITLPPIETPRVSYKDVAIARSRKNFAQTRQEVEEAILRSRQSPEEDKENEKGNSDTRRREGDSRPNHSRTDNRNNQRKPANQSHRERPERSDSKRRERPEPVKVGGEEHLQSLRSVLEEAMAEHQATKKEEKNENVQAKASSQKEDEGQSGQDRTARSKKEREPKKEPVKGSNQSEKRNPGEPAPERVINEIPESELRKILEVDKNK